MMARHFVSRKKRKNDGKYHVHRMKAENDGKTFWI